MGYVIETVVEQDGDTTSTKTVHFENLEDYLKYLQHCQTVNMLDSYGNDFAIQEKCPEKHDYRADNYFTKIGELVLDGYSTGDSIPSERKEETPAKGLEIGKKYRIVDNNCQHEFKMGEIVRVVEEDKYGNCYAVSKLGGWFITEDDVEEFDEN